MQETPPRIMNGWYVEGEERVDTFWRVGCSYNIFGMSLSFYCVKYKQHYALTYGIGVIHRTHLSMSGSPVQRLATAQQLRWKNSRLLQCEVPQRAA